MIITTRGHTTCQGLINRFIRDIQKFATATTSRPERDQPAGVQAAAEEEPDDRQDHDRRKCRKATCTRPEASAS